MRWVPEVRERLRGLFFRAREDANTEEELRFHLEMEAERLVREEGLGPEEARRQAAIAFGGMEKYREEVRDARGLGWTTGMLLDLKLGVRMLAKYPGLTVVGGLGMAVAIAIGAGAFEIIHTLTSGDLPLDEGDRVVSIQSWDAELSSPERRILHDFAAWREEVRSVEHLGAFRWSQRNVIGADGRAEPISVAEMTASGFRVARVPPLLGRYLVEEDERAGAPPVVVIGHDVWRTRFEGDPAVVGRTLQLGRTPHTVVGVMPEGFAFPVSFRYWTPLRADPSGFERREGPAIHVFGRLAPGATLDDARAELTAIGQRTAAALPGTHARLRPHVLPYTYPFGDLDDPVMVWIFRLVQLLVSLLLVVVAVNVSILVYARTAMRQGEIAVRSALGASRRRIVAQLFLEALVLAAAAAAVGLTITRLAFAQLEALATEGLDARLPFWIDFELSYATVAYVAGLAVLAAVIVGVAPAMKATGRRMRSSLSQLGGGTGIQLGRTWTVLIVAQVAVAVAVLPMAGAAVWNEFFRSAITGPAFPAEELLTARLGMSSDQGESEREPARFAALHSELVRRLEAEPGVSAVTFASRLPDAWFTGSIEVQGIRPGADVARHEVRFLQVDPGFLDVYEATLLAGRSFQPADQSGPATAVIANRSFVKYVLGGGQALGRRFRYTRAEDRLEPGGVETGGWYEIVGVVDDSPANESSSERSGATLYHPAAPGSLSPVSLVVRVQGIAPESLAGRLKEIATALDPSLRLEDVLSVHQIHRSGQRTRRMMAAGIAVTTLSVLLLSAAGIHALMSFTVTRRRKEIGIRSALGADPRRLLGSVFSRALGQIAVGLVAGVAAAALLDRLAGGELMGGAAIVLLPGIAAVMLAVGLLAALGPARRGLRIQPSEALKAE